MVAPDVANRFVNALLSDYIIEDRARHGRGDATFRLLAVAPQGDFEERLRKVTRTLGQQASFARSFPEAAERMRGEVFDIVLTAQLGAVDGACGRGLIQFVRTVKELNSEAVQVLAAQSSELPRLADVMIEGVYDYLPLEGDDFLMRMVMGRVADHAQLRRRSRELERALQVQNTALRQKFQEMTLLNEMSRDMTSMPDIDELLQRVLSRILEAFGSRCGSILIFDADAGDLVVRAAAGHDSAERVGQRRKLGEGIAGRVAQDRTPILVTDIEKDSRFADTVRGDKITRGIYRTGSFIAVPLVYHGRLIGEINITEKDTGAVFTADDLRLLSILSGHIASAVHGALAAAELRRVNEELRGKMSSACERLAGLRGMAEGLERMIGEAGCPLLAAAVGSEEETSG